MVGDGRTARDRFVTVSRHDGLTRHVAHDFERCARFSDKITRKIKDVERASVSIETDRALESIAVGHRGDSSGAVLESEIDIADQPLLVARLAQEAERPCL